MSALDFQIIRTADCYEIWTPDQTGAIIGMGLTEAAAKLDALAAFEATAKVFANELSWRERVIHEKGELDLKRDKLTTFLKNAPPGFLTDDELARLNRQWTAMETYSGILAERLAASA